MKSIPEVLIFQPPISVTQAGVFKANVWHMKFINYKELDEKYIFDLMNWMGGKDTLKTVTLSFQSKEEAIRYAIEKNFIFKEEISEKRKISPKSYANNFL